MVFKGEASEKCLYRESGALLNRTGALLKFVWTSFTRSYKKTDVYAPGSGPSPDSKSASTIALDFPASRRVTNKVPLFINHQSMVFFVIAVWTD